MKHSRGLNPPIIRAITNNDLLEIKNLINSGEDVNSVDHYGRTPLSYAMELKRSSDIARFLLDSGANPNIVDSCGYNCIFDYVLYRAMMCPIDADIELFDAICEKCKSVC